MLSNIVIKHLHALKLRLNFKCNSVNCEQINNVTMKKKSKAKLQHRYKQEYCDRQLLKHEFSDDNNQKISSGLE